MEEMSRRAIEARGNEALTEKFISENDGFILGCAHRSLGRYVTKSDDEYSIALIAFNEALEAYDEDKGEFGSFAHGVIRRRLIDYIRKESLHSQEISAGSMSEDTSLSDDEEARAAEYAAVAAGAQSDESSDAVPGTSGIADEIEAVSLTLAQYGFSFMDLTECSPQTAKTREACVAAIGTLVGDSGLMEQMRISGNLPIKEVCAISGVKRKVIERHRRYIIAAAEILEGDYPLMAEYLKYVR